MAGLGFSTEAKVSGPFFTQGLKALASIFEGSLEEAARTGAEMVRSRVPVVDGDFRDAIVGEVRKSRNGRMYGHVRAKPTGGEGLEARRPGRRLFLERGTRAVVKLFRGHKMFLRSRQALKSRERAIAQRHTSRALLRIR